jgi:hypothetical protein
MGSEHLPNVIDLDLTSMAPSSPGWRHVTSGTSFPRSRASAMRSSHSIGSGVVSTLYSFCVRDPAPLKQIPASENMLQQTWCAWLVDHEQLIPSKPPTAQACGCTTGT